MTKKKLNGKALLATFLAALILGAAVMFVATELGINVLLHSTGIMLSSDLQASWDAPRQNMTTAIDWGTLSPGSSRKVSFYLTNLGNATKTLMLATEHWNPSAAQYVLTLTWDRQGYLLHAGNQTLVTLTLTLGAPQNIQSFSFDVRING